MDKILVLRGLVNSRELARALIMEGKVLVEISAKELTHSGLPGLLYNVHQETVVLSYSWRPVERVTRETVLATGLNVRTDDLRDDKKGGFFDILKNGPYHMRVVNETKDYALVVRDR